MSNATRIILHPVTNEEDNSFVGIRIRNEEMGIPDFSGGIGIHNCDGRYDARTRWFFSGKRN